MNEFLEQIPYIKIRVPVQRGGHATVLVDGDYDGEWFSSLPLRVMTTGYVQVVPVSRPTGLFSGQFVYLHQLVMPKKKGYWVYHLNGNLLDNRSANLVYMTPKDVIARRKQPKRKTTSPGLTGSKYRGVSRLNKRDDKYGLWVSKSRWTVYVGKKYSGTFGSEEEAARQYDKLAKEEWGDLAHLNFPEVDNG